MVGRGGEGEGGRRGDLERATAMVVLRRVPRMALRGWARGERGVEKWRMVAAPWGGDMSVLWFFPPLPLLRRGIVWFWLGGFGKGRKGKGRLGAVTYETAQDEGRVVRGDGGGHDECPDGEDGDEGAEEGGDGGEDVANGSVRLSAVAEEVGDRKGEAMGEVWEGETVEEDVEGEVPACRRGEGGGHCFVYLGVLGKRFEELRMMAWAGMRT